MNVAEILDVDGVVGFYEFRMEFILLVLTRGVDPDQVKAFVKNEMNVGVLVEVMALDGYDFPETFEPSRVADWR